MKKRKNATIVQIEMEINFGIGLKRTFHGCIMRHLSCKNLNLSIV